MTHDYYISKSRDFVKVCKILRLIIIKDVTRPIIFICNHLSNADGLVLNKVLSNENVTKEYETRMLNILMASVAALLSKEYRGVYSGVLKE